jgi:chaperonin GroES
MMNSYPADSMAAESQQSAATEAISTNLVDNLDEEVLISLGKDCKQGFDEDFTSRSDWEEQVDSWIMLAKQVAEEKTYPWPGASNVKYPLLSTAALQFHARSYPSLIPSDGQVVKASVIGADPTGAKYDQATNVGKYMSYQFMQEMDGWEEGMDKLLLQLPIVGCLFKKTYFDKAQDKVCSYVVLPKNLVVNYWTTSLKDAERVSEVIHMSPRKLKEKQLLGLFKAVDLGQPQAVVDLAPEDADTQTNLLPYTIIEQHCFADLDEDGYEEPYIVTFEYNSGEVLRIQRRYHLDNVKKNDKGEIAQITPIQMYTKFPFFPNPDGGFYDIGFGSLLGPLNESVNTLINQLIDSGHLHNLQGGFIGKALRVKMGDQSLRPGEWRPVNAAADDLRKQIVPLPTKEPASVLFQLMGTLITSGKELASVAEIFTGKMPGQNTPATTTMATVEQGMKVFTAVYKRIFRALTEEFKLVFELNRLYTDPDKIINVLDLSINPQMFDKESCDIAPGADPQATSSQMKLQKAQALVELLQMAGPILNPIKVITRILEAQEQPNYQELFADQILQTGQVPPPAPDPKLLAIQAKSQVDQQKAQMDMQAKQFDMELQGREHELKMQMQAQQHAQKMAHEQEAGQLKAASAAQMANIFSATERMKSQQQMVQSDQQHSQKLQQAKETASLSQSQNSKSGGKAQSQKPSKKA